MGLLKKIKQRGIAYSFGIVFNRIVPQWLFRCRRFVVYQLDTNSQYLSATRESSVDAGWCETEEDIKAVEALTYFSRHLIPNDNDRIWACQGKIDGKLAGGFWAVADFFDEVELGVRLNLEPEQTWMFAAYVDKAFRRKGVYREILNFIIPAMVEKGFSKQLVSVNPSNIGSNKIHKDYSQNTTGYVFAIRLLSVTACFVSGDIEKERTITWSAKKNPIGLKVKSV